MLAPIVAACVEVQNMPALSSSVAALTMKLVEGDAGEVSFHRTPSGAIASASRVAAQAYNWQEGGRARREQEKLRGLVEAHNSCQIGRD